MSKLRLTRELIAEFERGVENGSDVSFLARAAGIPAETIRDWLGIGSGRLKTFYTGVPVRESTRALYQEFYEAIDRATAVKTTRMLESIHRAATTVNPKTLQPDWRAADTWLSKHPSTRADWHEAQKTVGIVHSRSKQDELAEALSDEELMATAQLLALPVTSGGDS